jgi:exoribonuclease R
MPSNRVVHVRTAGEGVAAQSLREGIARIQTELNVTPAFPAEVDEAAAAAAASPRLPDLDRTDIPFVTIDPPSSMDLDQALYLERDGDGYLVHYAIADVGAFVSPGDPVDVEAHRRGETLYGADSKVPLHPKVLSEGAASLLPDVVRPALLWTIKVDATGEGTDITVERARVRSTAKLDYERAQKVIDDGSASESLQLLAEVGKLRLAREAGRGGVSLPLPEQEIDVSDDTWQLEFRNLLPVEEWNAQISLLTGIAAAGMMREGGVGVLRTLPPAGAGDVARLHRCADALGIDWPDDVPYADLLPRIESRRASHAAFLAEATTLFRGADYVAFGVRGPGGGPRTTPPDDARHAAVGAPYAHVTAPLRRLVDRYGLEVCLALSAGRDVPEWVLEALPGLPATMRSAAGRASAFERACVDIVEAALLAHRVGRAFDAVVVEAGEPRDDGLRRGEVLLREPAVRARVEGAELPLGERVRVTLAEASVPERRVRFTRP